MGETACDKASRLGHTPLRPHSDVVTFGGGERHY